MAIAHVVLFRFTPGLSEPDRTALQRQVESHANEIGGMREVRFARLAQADEPEGWQYLMSMVFATKAELDRYLAHPVHMELYHWVMARGCELLVYDYDPDEAGSLRQPG
jgi:hypothetical protein